MNNTLNIKRIEKELELREATDNIQLETSYCKNCGHNHYKNIGHLNCQKCGETK